MSREQVANLISQLGGVLKLNDLKLDDSGFCSITFDNKIILSFDYFQEDDSLFMYIPLGQPKEDQVLEIYKQVLIADFFWKDTGGATIALEDNTGSLVIFMKLGLADLDISGFLSVVENFVNHSERWYDRINFGTKIEQKPTNKVSELQVNTV